MPIEFEIVSEVRPKLVQQYVDTWIGKQVTVL